MIQRKSQIQIIRQNQILEVIRLEMLQQEVIQQAETPLVVEIPQVEILQQAETQQMVEIQHNRSLKENYIL